MVPYSSRRSRPEQTWVGSICTGSAAHRDTTVRRRSARMPIRLRLISPVARCLTKLIVEMMVATRRGSGRLYLPTNQPDGIAAQACTSKATSRDEQVHRVLCTEIEGTPTLVYWALKLRWEFRGSTASPHRVAATGS